MLLEASSKLRISHGEYFNIAGEEVFQLPEVIDILLSFSTRKDIKVEADVSRYRPIDADYQMFDNTKIRGAIDWKPQIPARRMFEDLLIHWRQEIAKVEFLLTADTNSNELHSFYRSPSTGSCWRRH